MKCFAICIALFTCILTGGALYGQNQTKFTQTSSQIKYVFNRFHYSPLAYDDAFSERIFYLFQQEIDPYHSYLLQGQWDSLKVYRHTLDDELNGTNPGAFLMHFKKMYFFRWERIKSLSDQVYAKPSNYSIDEEYILENEKSAAFYSEKEWETHWRKKLKFSILSRLGELQGKSAIGALPDVNAEIKARLFMQKIYKKRIAKVLDDRENTEKFLQDIFFQCVVTAYDPHSMFIPADDKDDFDQELNALQTTFGIHVDENEEGEFYVAEVIPGSNAWLNGTIKSGDILVKLIDKQKKEIEFIDLTEEDVFDIFYQPEEESITVTIKGDNGVENTVTLIREVLKDDENVVQSWILKGEKNIGYISLPGFYFDWFGENPSGCANDVAKEILKMRNEKIEGLILDVRNNGGGSFMEAVEMAGIFIQEGPLLYTWEKNEKPKATKDPNRGTIYDGPMILMINGESASASEVLADILQDYNRALIVGTPSFGKATMQITLPLDSAGIKLSELTQYPYTSSSSTDYVNVTNGKLYRITGKTHQLHGVNPDIILPDLWQLAYQKEIDYDYTLIADTIKGSPYFTPLSPITKEELRTKSYNRTSTEFPFTDYTRRAKEVRELSTREGQKFPLKWDKFMAFHENNEQTWNIIDSLGILPKNTAYEVRNNSFNAMQTMGNEVVSQGEIEIQENIARDAQLMETYRIMLDFITQNK